MDIKEIYKIYLKASGISTDTRSIQKNSIFFALKGPNFDANSFAKEALSKGALFAIIDDPKYHTDNTILVNDSLLCLQNLARHHRQHLNYPIIGLTGSNGKTTTKELIYNVLSQRYKTKATAGNLNNHIGVALTILSFPYDLDMGIVEMGANHQKEIEFLCTISQPDYGLITNFGKAHLEGFGGVEGVIKGKSELYDYLRSHDKTAFINLDDPKQIKQIGSYSKISTFGSSKKNDCVVELVSASPFVNVNYHNELINTQLIGDYNFSNVAVAIAIGQYFDLDAKKIKKGLESYIPGNNRSQIIEKDSNKIILDAYNANPTSMMAALKNFKALEDKNKYLFLGDMFELGDEAEMEHQNIADYAKINFEKNVFLIGENFFTTNHFDANLKFKSFEDLMSHLKTISISNSTILIKGSRGMALERIIDLL